MSFVIYELEPIGKDGALEAVAVNYYCSAKCQEKGAARFPISQAIAVSTEPDSERLPGTVCEVCNLPL